jgi:hypothetical protein
MPWYSGLISDMICPRRCQRTSTIRHVALARRSNQERDQHENAFEDKERTGQPTGSSMDGMIGVVIGARIQKGGLMATFVSCIIAHHHFLIETLQIYKIESRRSRIRTLTVRAPSYTSGTTTNRRRTDMSIDPIIHGHDGWRDPAIVIGPFKPSYVPLSSSLAKLTPLQSTRLRTCEYKGNRFR